VAVTLECTQPINAVTFSSVISRSASVWPSLGLALVVDDDEADPGARETGQPVDGPLRGGQVQLRPPVEDVGRHPDRDNRVDAELGQSRLIIG
jgi:hypothetical protein